MSTFASPNDPFLENEIEPRMSIMAVVSFVCSMICCIPVISIFLGLLGAFLGVVALFLIGNSHGRLKGRGLAFAGVALGLLSSLAWIGLSLGAVRLLGGVVNQGTSAFQAIDAGDMTEARTVFMPSFDQSVSDAQMEEFGQMVRDDYGAFVAGPTSLLEYLSMFGKAGKSGLTPRSRTGEMPFALEYENGVVLAFMGMPMGSAQPEPGRVIRDLGYQRPDGTIVWLSEIAIDPAVSEHVPDDDGPGENESGGEGANEGGDGEG